MNLGTLYGIGVGPGDPELMTVKGARLLGRARHIFVPKARTKGESIGLSIARGYFQGQAQIHELIFPMTAEAGELSRRWEESAREIARVLTAGEDACFVTLGDPLLYSTYIYLLRALRALLPGAKVVTVPGVPAFGLAAALAEFPVGEGREPVTIVPAADDLRSVRRALAGGGTLVLMKVGRRLGEVLNLLEEAGVIEDGIFVARAGMEGQRVETDLRRLRKEGPEAGYLSIILVRAPEGKGR